MMEFVEYMHVNDNFDPIRYIQILDKNKVII